MSLLPFSNSAGLRLRNDVHVLRKLWHIGTGLAAFSIYFGLNIGQRAMAEGLLFFSLAFFAMETVRLRNEQVNRLALAVLGPFMRNTEKNSYSGLPFYALGASLALFLFEERIAVLGISFLVFGDPLSSYFGIKYGKDKILGNKSLQGALAGFVTCYFLTLIYGLYYSSGGFNLLAFSLLAGMVGSAAELLSINVDDNLTIPVISGLGLTFLNLFFHIF